VATLRSGEIKKTSSSKTSFVVAVDPRTGRLIRGFLGLLGVAFLGHATFGLVTGDMTFDGGYAVIEGGRHVHLTSPGGLATGAVVFGASGAALLLIAYDPPLVARWKWIFVGLGVAVITGVILISRGVR